MLFSEHHGRYISKNFLKLTNHSSRMRATRNFCEQTNNILLKHFPVIALSLLLPPFLEFLEK